MNTSHPSPTSERSLRTILAATLLTVLLLSPTLLAEDLPGAAGVKETVYAADAYGDPIDIRTEGEFREYDIPTTNWPSSLVLFARGADGGYAASTNYTAPGGGGAELTATFPIDPIAANALRPGGKLRFIVGNRGESFVGTNAVESDGGAGGGGTGFLYLSPVAGSQWQPLLIAGGGGGGYVDTNLTTHALPVDGRDAVISTSGSPEVPQIDGIQELTGGTLAGGADGGGGLAYSNLGGGGGGWSGDGQYGATGGTHGMDGGGNGGSGHRSGGWGCGGGGAAYVSGLPSDYGAAGGGGGGYSGGGGGSTFGPGGGGGSFVSSWGTNVLKVATTGEYPNNEIYHIGRVEWTKGAVVTTPLPDPVVTLNGPSLVEIPLFSTYPEQSASAVDLYGVNLGVSVGGTVNVNVPGDYQITYSATDSYGHTGTAVRTVRVLQLPLQVLYVDVDATGANDGSSWANAFTHLQDALAAAPEPAPFEIWVAEGSYRPDLGGGTTPGDIGASFVLKSNASLFGGFDGTETSRSQSDPKAHHTLLDGDLNGDGMPAGNSRHVVTAGTGITNSTVLEGFVISNGNAPGGSNSLQGGGLWINNASPTVRHCTFRDNRSAAVGGAVFVVGPATGLLIESCVFEDNVAQAQGSAFAAMGIQDPASTLPIKIHRCVFRGNEAVAGNDHGGTIWSLSQSLQVIDTLVAGNHGYQTGGIHMLAGFIAPTLELINVTLADNIGQTTAGGLFLGTGMNLRMENTIVWGNTVEQSTPEDWSNLNLMAGTTTTINHTLVENRSAASLGGVGNLDGDRGDASDPKFRSPQDGDYHLGRGLNEVSPAWNAGDIAANPIGTYSFSVDAGGATRVVASIVDLGAFETPAPLYVDATAAGSGNGLSWANAFTNVEGALAATTGGEVIRIAAGTYVPGTDRADSFRIAKGVSLFGGYPAGGGLDEVRDPVLHPTLLSGDIGAPGTSADNSEHVVVVDDSETSLSYVELDGLEVRNGKADSTGGAGIRCSEHLTVASCVVADNTAGGSGAGLECYGDGKADGYLTTFSGNQATGHGGAVWGGSGDFWQRCRFLANSSGGNGGALASDQPAQLIQCEFRGNDAVGDGGALHLGGPSAHVSNSLFSGNRSAGKGGGLSLTNGVTSSVLFGLTVTGNAATTGGGGIWSDGSGVTLRGSVLWANQSAGSTSDPTASFGGVAPTWRNALAQGLDLTTTGIDNLDGTLPAIDPLFIVPVDPASAPTVAGDLHLSPSSPLIDAGGGQNGLNDLDDNSREIGGGMDIGAYELQAILFVDASATGAGDGSSWADAYPSMQAALADLHSWEGDEPGTAHAEIWIAAGTYVPDAYDFSGGPQGFHINFDLIFRGGFPAGGGAWEDRDAVAHPVILDATGTNGRVLTIDDGSAPLVRNVVLDGVTVRGGTCYEDGAPVGSARGGGIWSRENLTLVDVVVENNTASFMGGGLFLDQGSAVLDHCTIADNTASGYSISPAIGYSGGGIFANNGVTLTLDSSDVLANQSTYSNSRGAGLCVLAGATVNAVNCRIAGNLGKDRGGAIYAYQATTSFESCAFTGNTGFDGGAVFHDQCPDASYVNCTISGNAAKLTNSGNGDGGGIVNSASTLTLTSTIVWGNLSALAPGTATDSIVIRNGGTVSYSHSVVEGIDLTATGTANLDGTAAASDPLFVLLLDPATAPSEAGDFRLQQGSPALDAGDSAAATVATDLAGFARIQGAAIDLGAYEGAQLSLTPYDLWALAWFGSGSDPAVSGPQADPNADDVVNYVSFLTATSPFNASPEANGVVETDSDVMRFIFRRSDRAAEYNPRYRGSFDLLAWEDPANLGPDVSITVNDDYYGIDFDGSGIDRVVIEVNRASVARFFARMEYDSPTPP